MKCRFVDRHGWVQWREVENRGPRTVVLIDERSMEIPFPSFADPIPPSVKVREMVFHRQDYRHSGVLEVLYSQDDEEVPEEILKLHPLAMVGLMTEAEKIWNVRKILGEESDPEFALESIGMVVNGK